MNDYEVKRRITFIFVGLCLGIPILIMFWHPGAGALLLMVGAMSASRAIRFLTHNGEDGHDRLRKMDKAGNTILVQIVDDFGRPLSPLEADRRMKSAREKAGPRDIVVPVRFRVENKVEILDKQSKQNS